MRPDRKAVWGARRRGRPARADLLTSERGLVVVFVGLGLLAFVAAAMLAIDVGHLMTARAQAQNAADAGALAGAVALVFDDYVDRSPDGPAVQSALAAAAANPVMGALVSVTPADVEFPLDPSGEPTRVRVTVSRRAARGNPLATLVARAFGIRTVDVVGVATAEAAPANAATCVKPWAIPDKWDERQTPPWDESDTFDLYDARKRPLPDPDVYVPADRPGYTGFRSDPNGPDYGRVMLLKAGNPHEAVNPSHFYPIALPPNSGAQWYEANIPGCYNDIVWMGQEVPVEPGNMTGPTVSGTEALIAKDPDAYWDSATRRVVSRYHPSPRIVVLPVFDPQAYEEGRERGRLAIRVANLVGFFIEGLQGRDVLGRTVPMTGLVRAEVGPVPGGAFLRAIRLVE
jgi:Flp pilus assembly protein TadG